MHKSLLFFPGLILVSLITLSAPAQTRIETTTAGQSAGSSGATVYRFLFDNERFIIQHQTIEFDETGRGTYTFKKKGEDEVTCRLEISRDLVAQIRGLFAELNFLDSTEDYQFKKDFSHLGNVTITHARGGRERTVKFNYTASQPMNRIVEIFRNIATQEERVYELQAVRQSDPISTPAQLRLLETELKAKRIADPQRLTPLLEEIRTDESVPLIARNHADRLIKSIQKGK
ncbi:MAG TPA: hypothetical protein VNQ79_25035 [Blastocatellia bacterium]|nr:hypothetical protein [Blastocatellia bacterium]